MNYQISVEGFNRLLFDKRELKEAFRKGGAVVRKEARRLIARKAISGEGDFPGQLTGAMMKSIKVKPGSGGGYVKIMPYMTEAMRAKTTGPNDEKADFYPAFLMVGTRRGLRPRKDFMVQALDNKQTEVRAAIHAALRHAIRTA